MQSKNVTALFVTYCIALLIAWVAWGRTTEHIWSAWLLLVLFIIGIAIFISSLVRQLRDLDIDSGALFAVIGIVIFGLITYSLVGDINIQFLTILDYIFSGVLALLLIFTGARYIQK